MDWTIIETNKLTSQDIDRQGNKFLIGNGYIGYRGTLEEFTQTEKTATIVSGLYDKVEDKWREPVNLPNGGYIQILYKGEQLHALTTHVVTHLQKVNMYTGVHERQTTFETPDGAQFTITARRFASLKNRHLICMEYIVQSNREQDFEILTGIDGDVWDLNGPHLTNFQTDHSKELISLSALTQETRIPIIVTEAIALPDDFPAEAISIEISSKNKITRRLRIHGGIRFHKFIAHVTGLDSPTPQITAQEHCIRAKEMGFDTNLSSHSSSWHQRWRDCDIQIQGDDEAQLALRFCMYHLLSIVPAHTDQASIPARGMSGQMYKGAIFWDTELFILPFFIHTFPNLARNLLLYRYHTLDGARRKAQEYHYRGAFYAWESQDTGDDACTLFNVTDVFTNRPIRTYFKDKQIHISADIPYAFWKYYNVTGDQSIWNDGGAEVIFECARFFLSYTYYNPNKQQYEYLDVTGPDEYHERVHNNTFTNRMIAHTFAICLWVAEALRQTNPNFYNDLINKLNFQNDLDMIRGIAPQIYQPDINAPGELIPQFDGYFELENISLSTLLDRKLHPHEYFGGGCGLATTTQIIKQADVVLTLALFDTQYPLETKTANWQYYEPRTEHGSSLSACSYSIIAAQIGEVDWAYKYFLKTADIDLTGIGKQYVGTLYIGGTHPASSGGAWMSAVFGLSGIQWQNNTLSINPCLPEHWEKITIPLTIQNQNLLISITKQQITVKPSQPLEIPISISSGEFIGVLHPIQGIEIPIPISKP